MKKGTLNWTLKDDLYLRMHYGKHSVKELAQKFQRSEDAIRMRAHNMGLQAKGTAAFSERMRAVSIVREAKKKEDGAVFEHARSPEQLEKMRVLNKAAYESDPEKAQAKNAQWKANHPTYHADYYSKNKVRVRARIAQWEQENRAHLRIIKARNEAKRRARKAQAKAIDSVCFDAVYERDRGVCWICLRWSSRNHAHFDHYIPLAQGGTHTQENLKVTHELCNLRKQDDHPESERVKVVCEELRNMSEDLWQEEMERVQKSRVKRNAWTAEDKAFLRQNYLSHSRREISKILGRSIGAIGNVAKRIGLQKAVEWTEEQKVFITNHYGKMSAQEVAQAVGHSAGSVHTMAWKLGVKCNYEFRKKPPATQTG